jgi:3-oxoacyl-[acyl-carrier protein] reductase
VSGRLQGRVALVTGASRGIGAGIAERLAEEGAVVTIGDVNDEVGQATARRLGAGYCRCDVADAEQVEAALAEVVQRHGRIDILCQNAGIFPLHDLEDISVDEWDRVLAVNLRGCFLAIRAALPAMKRQRYGRIVLTSSITGPRVSQPGHAHYASSKAGINGLIKSAALEAAAFGVTVNGVEPGNIATEGMASDRSPEYAAAMAAAVPLGRLGTPRDVANAVLFLGSDDAAYITGTTIIVDGGQILPEAKL